MSERARYERDGDLGVITIDDPPLNLFGRELTEAVHGGPRRRRGGLARGR